jgi:hypothetical protein
VRWCSLSALTLWMSHCSGLWRRGCERGLREPRQAQGGARSRIKAAMTSSQQLTLRVMVWFL